MERLWRIIPHFLLIFVIFSSMMSPFLGFFLTMLVVTLLICFRLPCPDKTTVENILQTHKTSILAHKGGAIDAPENTLAAIHLAKKNGADGIEFDVGYTSDDIAILMHDDTVDRTTDGSGKLKHITLEQLKKLDASAKHPKRAEFQNEQVPTLEEAVELMVNLDLRIYFDVKEKGKKSTEVICGLYKKHPKLYKTAIVCSFYPDIIYSVRRADPGIITGMTWRPWYVSKKDIAGPWRSEDMIQRGCMVLGDVLLKWCIYGWLWFLCGNSAFLLHKDCFSVEEKRYWENRGIHLVIWTVNEEETKDYLTNIGKVTYMTDSLIRNKE